MNRIKICENNKKNIGTAAPPHILRFAKDTAYMPSNKQIYYYQSLLQFCQDKNVDISFLHKPKDRSTIKSYISAVITILRKNNLDKEFFNKEVSNNRTKSDE